MNRVMNNLSCRKRVTRLYDGKSTCKGLRNLNKDLKDEISDQSDKDGITK